MAGKRYRRLEDLRGGGLLFVLCWAAYFSSYIGRYNYSAAMADIAGAGLLSPAQAGLVATFYFLCYGAGQIFSGILGDRVSPFGMVFWGLLGSGAANGAMLLCRGFAGMAGVWALNGLAQSLIWAPIMRIFAEILPTRQQNRACIHITSTVAAGTLASYGVSAAAMALFGWRGVFPAAALLLILAAALWALATGPIRRACVPPPRERGAGGPPALPRERGAGGSPALPRERGAGGSPSPPGGRGQEPAGRAASGPPGSCPAPSPGRRLGRAAAAHGGGAAGAGGHPRGA